MTEGQADSPPEPAKVPSSQPAKILENAISKAMPEKAAEILRAIPQEKRQQIAGFVWEQTSIRIGPIPPPEELAAYNQIIPNGADRILKMAEAQSAHRIEIEKLVIGSQQKQSSRGQHYALVVALVAIGLATWAALHGQPTFGGILGGGTVVSLVGACVYAKREGKRDLAEKRQIMIPTPTPPIQHSNRKKRHK